MPFGIKEASSHFQRLIESVLAAEEMAFPYIDDVIVLDFEAELPNLKRVIKLLNDNNLQLNADKCTLNCRETIFLGHMINSRGELGPDPKKIQSIREARQPENKSDLRKLLGIANYVRAYNKNAAVLADQLYAMTSNKRKFVWDKSMREAYDKFKQSFSEQVLLQPFDPNKEALIYVDASQTAIGASLIQDDKPVAFFGKQLSKIQRKWPATQRECYALISAFREFDSNFPLVKVQIKTDNKAVANANLSKIANRTISAWMHEIIEAGVTIQWTPGENNIFADFISRFQIEKESESPDKNSDDKSNPTKQAAAISIKDPQEMEDRLTNLHVTYCHLATRSLFFQAIKLPELKGFKISDIKKMCKKITATCNQCLKWKSTRAYFHKLQSDVSSHLGTTCHIDLAELPKDKLGNQYILVMRDHITSFIRTEPLQTKEAAEVARALLAHFMATEFPTIIAHDNGAEFVNKVLDELKKQFGIATKLSIPYHPESNGAAESAVKIVKEKILQTLDGNIENWSLALPWVTYVINSTPHSRTGLCPSFLFFGRKLREVHLPSMLQNLQGRIQDIHRFQSKVEDLISFLRQAKIKNIAGRNLEANLTHEIIKPNTIVHIKDTERHSKQYPRYVGPFVVHSYDAKRHGYLLKFSNGRKFHKLVPRNLIKVGGNLMEDRITVKQIIREQDGKFLCKIVEGPKPIWIDQQDFDNQWLINKFRRRGGNKEELHKSRIVKLDTSCFRLLSYINLYTSSNKHCSNC